MNNGEEPQQGFIEQVKGKLSKCLIVGILISTAALGVECGATNKCSYETAPKKLEQYEK